MIRARCILHWIAIALLVLAIVTLIGSRAHATDLSALPPELEALALVSTGIAIGTAVAALTDRGP